MDKIRFLIAHYLDRKDDTCWANLALWAGDYHSLRETFGASGNWKTQICREGCKETPYAYCGKCEKTGRFYGDN